MSTSVFGQLDMYMREMGLGFFVLLIVILGCYFWKAETDYKKRIVLIVLLSCGLIFNNYSLKAVGLVVGLPVYYRFFWAVPILIVISKGLVDAICWKSKIYYRIGVVVLGAVVLFTLGNTTLDRQNFRLPYTVYHFSGEVIEIAHIMNEHKNQERPVIIGTVEVMQRIKQYDGGFVWGIGREPYRQVYRRGYDAPGLDSSSHTVVRAVELGIVADDTIAAFQEIIDRRGVEFIITFTEFQKDDKMIYLDFHPIGYTNRYTVYQRNDGF